MKEFLVGMAKSDITPKVGTLLFGYPSERVSQRVLDNLYLGAVAIKQEEETVLFVSADLCTISVSVVKEAKDLLYKNFNLKKENIVISSTHTHSGPITSTSAGWGTQDDKYIQNIFMPALMETTEKALKSLKTAVMGVGIVESYDTIINRRQIENGEAILGQNPDLPYDPKMTVISFKTPDNENIGSIIHFAAHPTACWNNLSITRDWPGIVVDKLEEITNAPSVFVNGAIGNVGPKLPNGKTTQDEPAMIEIGKRIAEYAQEAYEKTTEYTVPEIKIYADELLLPCVKAPSLESVLKEIEAMGNPDDLIEVDITKYDRLQKIKKMYESGIPFDEGVTLDHTVISFGDLAIVPLPFELFCEISLGIQEKSPFSKTLVLGLTNGSRGYLPTEEEIPYGGYEVASFRAASIPGFIDGLDKHLVKENVKFLNKLKNK